MFGEREEAGELLAQELAAFISNDPNAILLALRAEGWSWRIN